MNVKLIHGDCIEEMQKLIDNDVKVDLVLTDPPYGTTACKWDTIIPFKEMWDCLNELSYNTTPILLFATSPYSAELIHSNLKNFKYNLIWDKHYISNPFMANKRPLRVHEEINVFYKKQPVYNPQRIPKKIDYDRTSTGEKAKVWRTVSSEVFGGDTPKRLYYVDDGTRYPQTIISHYSSQADECQNAKKLHPTQKPVALLKYLIKTYTKEGDTVLDFTMGSGSTGVACLQTNRNFIGIELDEKYYNIAKKRCSEYQSKLMVKE